MVSTPTAILGFEQQGSNDNYGAWWQNANQVFQVAEDAITGALSLSTTAGDTALTVTPYAADQARLPIIRIGAGAGAQTALIRVTAARKRLYLVSNETPSGSFATQFGYDTSNLVTIPRGSCAFVLNKADGSTALVSPLIVLATGKIDTTSLGAITLGQLDTALQAQINNAASNASAALSAATSAQSTANSANTTATAASAAVASKQDHSSNLDDWSAIATATKLTAASNLSDVAVPATARANLGVPYATKAQMVAETAGVVPEASKVGQHPGVPKAWLLYNCSTQTIIASYNVTSVVRDNTGQITTTFTVPFVNTNYGMLGSARYDSTFAAATVTAQSTDTKTANAMQVSIGRSATGATFNSTEVFIAWYGAQ